MEKNLRTFSKALFFRSSTAGTLADVFIFFLLFPSAVEHIADGATLCRRCISVLSRHTRYFLQRNAIYVL